MFIDALSVDTTRRLLAVQTVDTLAATGTPIQDAQRLVARRFGVSYGTARNWCTAKARDALRAIMGVTTADWAIPLP